MGFFSPFFFVVVFWFADFALWTLTGSWPDGTFFVLPEFIIIPVELMYFVMLCNAFRERTCKHESERKSYESSERRFNNHSLRKTYKPTECQK